MRTKKVPKIPTMLFTMDQPFYLFIQTHKLFSPNKMTWNISLLTSARVPSTLICVFCYKDTLFSIFQWVYQKEHKGRFWRKKKALNSLNKCKLFIEHIHPSNLCRKNVTLLSTFKVIRFQNSTYFCCTEKNCFLY